MRLAEKRVSKLPHPVELNVTRSLLIFFSLYNINVLYNMCDYLRLSLGHTLATIIQHVLAATAHRLNMTR